MTKNAAAKPSSNAVYKVDKVKQKPNLRRLLEGFHALHAYIAADINLTTIMRHGSDKSKSETVKAFVKYRIGSYLQRAIEELHVDADEEYGLLFDKSYMQVQFTPGDAVNGTYKATDIRVVLKPVEYADCDDTFFLEEDFIFRTGYMDYYASTNKNNITKIVSVMNNRSLDQTPLISVSAVTEEDYSECLDFALAHAVMFGKSNILMPVLSIWDHVVLSKDEKDVPTTKVNASTFRR